MKRTLSMLAIAACFLGTACTTATEYGDCTGLASETKPTLHYEVSKWNVFVAFLFSESFFVPGWVVLFDYKCPTGKYSQEQEVRSE